MSDDSIARRARAAERVRQALDAIDGLRWKSLELTGEAPSLRAAIVVDARNELQDFAGIAADLRRQMPDLAEIQVSLDSRSSGRWWR